MSVLRRARYLRRVAETYVGGRGSNLSFWHETPEREPHASPDALRHYFMTFHRKADHQGPFTDGGVPLLDYRGDIGPRINPIAVAQYGLGNLNLWWDTGAPERLQRARVAGDHLVATLVPNAHGVPVWMHDFDWDYRETLEAPWYSGLAQGQGISLLTRLHHETGNASYGTAAEAAFASLITDVRDGGVRHVDGTGTWIEEYIVHPPTHILNGFLWALWGVHDMWKATGDAGTKELFDAGSRTVLENIHRYDTGYWSLYELSGTRLPMIASAFYHRLHIVQLDVMHLITGEEAYARWRDRWRSYTDNALSRRRAGLNKAIFKLVHY